LTGTRFGFRGLEDKTVPGCHRVVREEAERDGGEPEQGIARVRGIGAPATLLGALDLILTVGHEPYSPAEKHREGSVAILRVVCERATNLDLTDHRGCHGDVAALDAIDARPAFPDDLGASAGRGSRRAVDPRLPDLRDATTEQNRQEAHRAQRPGSPWHDHPL